MKIIAAATMINGTVWAIPAPARHHHIVHWLAKDLKFHQPVFGKQGFITDTGEFLDRKQARALAVRNGQCPAPDHATDLFSEDLW